MISLVATVSLWVQIHGLIGAQGLLPATDFFRRAGNQLGPQAFWVLPSLGWWAADDTALHAYCGLAATLSVGLIVGFAPRLILVLLWTVYLSLVVAGQDFLSFQWDILLLEMLACSVLYAPPGWHPRWETAAAPLPSARWLIWLLACKLMFLSGMTKLLSGDTSWLDGTALHYHYFTQPLPNPLSWSAHQMPRGGHTLALAVMLAVEILLPLLVFAGRVGRTVFGLSTIVLMVLIELTGNYGFFNLQTVVLCLPLLDATILRQVGVRIRRTPAARRQAQSESVTQPPRSVVLESPAHRETQSISSAAAAPDRTATPVLTRLRATTGTTCAVVMILLSGLVSGRELVRTARPAAFGGLLGGAIQFLDKSVISWNERGILAHLAPWRTINGYGLFRVMTKVRFEIVIETTMDGERWEACALPYQPGPVGRIPPLIAPHMPRLDWQMWFAGLNPRGSEHWLSALVLKILEGNPSICRLIGHPEFVATPPQAIRLVYYKYQFSDPIHRRASEAWWSRTQVVVLMEPRTRQGPQMPPR